MQCQYEGCTKKATAIAAGRDYDGGSETHPPGAGHYCEEHAEWVADEGGPEYHTSCPNCGCLFGVN